MPTPITVSVNFIDLTGNTVLGYMQAAIVPPTGVFDLYVSGLGIIAPKLTTSTTGTTVSVSIWGNDVVVDAADNAKDTYYTINLFNTNNILVWTGAYLFTGTGPINLVGYPLLTTIPPPTGPVPSNILTGNNTFTGTNVFSSNTIFNGGITTSSFINTGNETVGGNLVVTGTSILTGAVTALNPANNLVIGTLNGFTMPNPLTGLVTSFSAGTLSPLFTTSVATPTSTPALSFTLSSASANLVFANCTGGSAPPSFCSLTGAMLPNPSATTLGGIQSFALVANQWIDSISTSGVPHASQPAFTNISGTLPINRLVAGSNGQIIETVAGVPTWVTSSATAVIQTQSVSGCTTAAPPGSVCSNTVTWPVPFADASYTAVCQGISPYTSPQTGGTFGVPVIGDVRTYAAASIEAVTTNINQGNIAAAYTTIKCIGIHL